MKRQSGNWATFLFTAFSMGCSAPATSTAVPDVEETASAVAIASVEPEKKPTQPRCGEIAVVFVVDRSGSMSGKPIEAVHEGLGAAVQQLCGDDALGIIAFDASPQRMLGLGKVSAQKDVDGTIRRIQPDGGTALHGGLQMALHDLRGIAKKSRHIVIATDGLFPTEELLDMTKTAHEDGITVSTIAIGTAPDMRFLADLALAGGGTNYEVTDLKRLPGAFSDEIRRIRKP